MKLSYASASDMSLVGGRLWLDFVNTVGGVRDLPRRKSDSATAPAMVDKLEQYSDLVAWRQHAGVITATEARHLIQAGKRNQHQAGEVFGRAIALREALYRVSKAIVTGDGPASADLKIVNNELLTARSHEELISTAGGFGWKWTSTQGALDRMLWSIAQSAAEFLTTGDLSRLRQCSGEKCGWLFEDTSRNRSRLWCQMSDCGNLAKVRRFRSRQRRN